MAQVGMSYTLTVVQAITEQEMARERACFYCGATGPAGRMQLWGARAGRRCAFVCASCGPRWERSRWSRGWVKHLHQNTQRACGA